MFLITAYRFLTAGSGSGRGLFALAVTAVFIAVVARGFASPDVKSPRGRLRAAAWNVALMVLSIVLASALGWSSSALMGATAAAAAIVFFRPRWVRDAAAAALLAVGLAGFAVARTAGYGVGGNEQLYGVALVNGDGGGNLTFYLLLPQAYLFVFLGSWLGWRSARARRESAGIRRLLGRLAEPEFAVRPWGLLLLPVTIIAAAMVGPNLWFGAMAAGTIWPVLVIFAAVRPGPAGGAGHAPAGGREAHSH